MSTHADKTQDNKSKVAENATSHEQRGGESTLQFVDNRPAAVMQRRLQEVADNSPQVKQLRAFQEITNNSTQASHAVQLRAMANNYTGQQQLIQKKKNGTGLPDNLKSGIENLSGYFMDDVKVHRNSDKPAQLQAHAYAQGTDIYLASGQEKHLPHEAWHVAQQKQGRVKPALQMKRGVNVNDDAELEKEADVMGALALGSNTSAMAESIQTKSLFSNNINTQRKVVQKKSIKSAGLELELKGASIAKGDEEFGEHEKVIDKGSWWIEVDSYNPELVTDPSESKVELFNWLAFGNAILKNIQLLAKKSAELAKLPEGEPLLSEVLKIEIASLKHRLGLPAAAVVTIGGNLEYLAKPQITFGIDKEHLSKFVLDSMGPKITHAEGYTKSGQKYTDTQWPRVNTEVSKIWSSSPMWRNTKGQSFLAKLKTVSNEAKGLSLLTVVTLLFATRKQSVDDVWQYYKARFSVMPRVPLSDLYDATSEKAQTEYKELMGLWVEAIAMNNAEKPEDDEGYYPDKIFRSQKNKSISIKTELISIVLAGKRHPKTREGGEKQVDAISSDEMASTTNVGKSVGMLDLPESSGGIYEIRTIPYIKINDDAKVRGIYNEIIAAYGGMD